MKLKNIYRTGIKREMIETATLAPNIACLRKITEESLQVDNGGIILTGTQAESRMGVPLYELVACGQIFADKWDATPGEHYLISFVAGDPLGEFAFVEAEDILLRWGSAIYE